VTFGHPLVLVALLVVPTTAALWLAAERRRQRSAAAFASPALLPNLVARAPGRLRLVPPALFLVALTALIVGFARPHANVTVPRHEATVVLAIDVSRSMQARDIAPSRMVAAQRAASELLDKIPATYSVAVVGFATHAFVAVPPTQDRALVRQALASLAPGEGTAIGDAVALAAQLGQRQRATDGTVPPESVLVLSDGARDGGRTSLDDAVKQATALHVPVSTVLLGTAEGIVQQRLVGGYTAQIRVPPDPGVLRQLARATRGRFYQARSAEALADVYRHLATRVGHKKENREVTDVFAGGALVLLLAGGAFSMLTLRRVP
jgi:Ca-activated chloride channel homolog